MDAFMNLIASINVFASNSVDSINELPHPELVYGLMTLAVGWVILAVVFKKKKAGLFIEDFATASPPVENQVSPQEAFEMIANSGFFRDDISVFQGKMLERAGLGTKTYIPPCVAAMKPDRAGAYEELEIAVLPCIDEILQRNNMAPKDIDFLVVNCSLFCPTPSISAWIVNHYKMPSKVRTFQIGGMGCSASLIGVDLVKELLAAHPDKKALLISTENISLSWYEGNEHSMVLQNTLFRMGAAAILFTGRRTDKSRYNLKTLLRTHHGRKQESYDCVVQKTDSEGNLGVHLTKNVPSAAGKAITENISVLGRSVLPFSEKAKFALSFINQKVFGAKTVYTPNFKKAFSNVCIHTGGRAVIDTVQKNLSLSDADVEASRATLYRYGNTSSSSVWYELAYHEEHRAVKRGSVVWQVAFGSGFKCNSAVWTALKGCEKRRHVFDAHEPGWTYNKDLEGYGKPPAIVFKGKYGKIVEEHRARKAAEAAAAKKAVKN